MQVRYLNARKVGAPECVYDLFEYKMKEGESIIHLTTQPPEQRRRCLMRRQPALAASDDEESDDGGDGQPPAAGGGSDGLRFFNGLIEKYENRPEGVAHEPDGTPFIWDNILYPDFWRRFNVQAYKDITAAAKQCGALWPMRGERTPANG